MVEVYRDRLKLDVMVVNAFNQILTIQPDNLRRSTRWPAQYEAMGRWPELIALLRKKAAVVESARGQGRACTCGWRTCSWRSSPTRPRRSRRSRRSWSWIPDNSEALGYLKQMYEKRRDWDKLVAVNQREIDKLSDADERKAPAHRGGQAGLREAEEAVGLDRAVAEGAGGRRRRTSRRWASWRSCTSARRRGPSWARCWSGRWPLTDDAARKRALYVKLAMLYTEKVQDAGAGDRPPGRRCWRWSRTTAAPRTRSEAVPAAEGLGRAGGVLRLAEQVGRARARARAPGRDRGRQRHGRPVEQDRRAVSRSPEQGGPRAEGVREGAVASTPRTCRRRRR